LDKRLTLSATSTDLPKAGPLTQPVQPLPFDQLGHLWLEFLS